MINIVCFCGSTKFKQAFEQANRQESLKGNIVLSLPQFSQADNIAVTEEEIKILKQVHYEKIKLADEILVINVDGYIGEATKQEIEFAKSLGKSVRYLEKI
ncbi:MAG TPA: hypothetical protein DCL21_05645 [Alphaproteobacteria bacterium]|nr:hypothetical protein [Alphaproteobacteria bacterium]